MFSVTDANSLSALVAVELRPQRQTMGRVSVAKTTKKKTSKKATASKSKSKGSSTKATAKKTTKKKSAKKTTSRKKAAGDTIVTVDRRDPKRQDRRQTELEEILNSELESAPVERREKVNRRRQIDPTTCERDYNNEEIEFMHALDDYKRRAGRMFPTCSEILEVVRELGYHRLNPEQMATLGLGQESEQTAAEQTDAEQTGDTPTGENQAPETVIVDQSAESMETGLDTGDAVPNEFSEAVTEVAAANELSGSIRSESEPTAF